MGVAPWFINRETIGIAGTFRKQILRKFEQ
jgi:hypothetical protein